MTRTGWIKATARSGMRRSVRMRRTAKRVMSRARKINRLRIPIRNIAESRIVILKIAAADQSVVGRLPCARRVSGHAMRATLPNAVFDAIEGVRLKESD